MGLICLSHAIVGYWLALVPLFCVAFRGLLLWGTKGEYLILKITFTFIWTVSHLVTIFVLSIALNHKKTKHYGKINNRKKHHFRQGYPQSLG